MWDLRGHKAGHYMIVVDLLLAHCSVLLKPAKTDDMTSLFVYFMRVCTWLCCWRLSRLLCSWWICCVYTAASCGPFSSSAFNFETVVCEQEPKCEHKSFKYRSNCSWPCRIPQEANKHAGPKCMKLKRFQCLSFLQFYWK